MVGKPLRFSDFAEQEGPFEGKKRSINDILNLEILVLDFKLSKSKFKGKCDFYITIQFSIDQEKYILFTGSKVLKDQLEKYKEKLPFFAKIVKVDKYFTFV